MPTLYLSELSELNSIEFERWSDLSSNAIEVSDSIFGLVVMCGQCHSVTNWQLNSGHFCCRWAGEMYQRYFEKRFARR